MKNCVVQDIIKNVMRHVTEVKQEEISKMTGIYFKIMKQFVVN